MPSPVTALIGDRAGVVVDQPLGLAGGEVGLVEHEQLGHAGGVDLGRAPRARRRSGPRGSAALASTTWTR